MSVFHKKKKKRIYFWYAIGNKLCMHKGKMRMWTSAQTPQASCEMPLPRGLLNTKLIAAKEGRKVLLVTTNRVNGRGWGGSSFLICLTLVVPVYFRKASYIAGAHPAGALNSLNFSVIVMSWILSVIPLILLGARVTKLQMCILHQLENEWAPNPPVSQ